MNLSRCSNGHFYDKEKYASCPHCGTAGAGEESLTTVYTEEVNQANPLGQPADMATVPLDQTADLPIGGVPVDQVTVPTHSGSVTERLDGGIDASVDSLYATSTASAFDDDDDHTVAFMDDLFSEVSGGGTSSNTQGVSAAPASQKSSGVSSPCVGWLIAIGGAHIGQDFRLKVGKNFIGRSSDMDVSLTNDKSVSRNRHAIVVYEPKQHLYLVQPGESSSLVYKNNEVVLSPVPLEAYDQITVGDVNLVFMPLCNDNFNWSDLLTSLQKKA